MSSIFKITNWRINLLMHNHVGKIILLLFIVLQSCGSDKKQSVNSKPIKIPIVKVQEVKVSEIISYIDITGTIRANIYTDIIAPADGIIENLFARENQFVNKDNIIAIINPDDRVSIISKNQFALKEIKAKISNSKSNSSSLDSLKLELQKANQDVSFAEKMYQTIPIICPMSGLVTQRWTDIGNQVSVRDKILTISDMSSLVIKAELNEKYYENITKGQKLSLNLNAYPNDTLQGIVSLIYPQINSATRNFQFDIRIHNFKKTLIPGMLAYIKIPVASHKNAISVPEKAVITSPDNETFIFTISKDSIVHKIKVEIGMSSGNSIEIAKSLKAKDKIVIAGQQMLKDSMKVKIIK